MWVCVVSLSLSLLSCRGVVRVDVNLQDVDIDQCSSEGWFAGTHRCNATTMEVSEPTRLLATLLTRALLSVAAVWLLASVGSFKVDASIGINN